MRFSVGKPKPVSYSDGQEQRDRGLRILRGPAVEPVSTVHPVSAGSVEASEAAIRQQLDRMLRSRIFIQSERLSRFLRFIVEQTLAGNGHLLKEYLIGSEVYDRKPPYHPSQDSIVRTEARRLRGKLKEYYEDEGKDDSVYVYLRPGSYIPVFHSRAVLAGMGAGTVADHLIVSTKGSAIAIAILPFRDISESLLSSRYARGIPEELAYTLMRANACKVISRFSIAHCSMQDQDVAAMMRKVGADIALEGSVRAEGDQIRITASAFNVAGLQLWSQRIDVDADLQTCFRTEEQIASSLFNVLSAVIEGQRLGVLW
jgi:TolB-like protein